MAFAAAGLVAAGLVAAVDPAVASTEQPIAAGCTEELAAGSADILIGMQFMRGKYAVDTPEI